MIIIRRIYLCLNGPNKFKIVLMLNYDFFFQKEKNLQFKMSRILIIGTHESLFRYHLGWPLSTKGQSLALLQLCVFQRGDAESIQSTWAHPEDIPCLFLALWHYLFGLGKLQRNACFLLKHHRLSSPGQVFSPVTWLFPSGFILAVLGRKKKSHI